MKNIRSIFFFFLVLPILSRAQISAAVGDFENRTDLFYLESWTQKIPEYLANELSRSPEITVVDRLRLKSVLDEQKLRYAGLTDSTKAIEIGKLLSAQTIITGFISKSGDDFRIDARITNVSTGRMVIEKVSSRSPKHLERMVALLANNLKFQMTGSGEYRESVLLRKYPTRYFLAAVLVSGTAAAILNQSYQNKLDQYHQTAQLNTFDSAYRSANRLYHVRTAVQALSAAALTGTIICWIHDWSPDRIFANPQPIKPVWGIQQGEIRAGFRIAL